MKKPGVMAASLLTACLFAVGLAAVAHHALAPGAAPELVETANAAEVRQTSSDVQRRTAAPSTARSTGADRAASADAEKTSAARLYRSAVRGKSMNAGRDDDDDDDDD